MAAEHTISLALFFVAIPFLWNYIDTYSEKELVKGPAASKRRVANTYMMSSSIGTSHYNPK
jgi:hypothetical protein